MFLKMANVCSVIVNFCLLFSILLILTNAKDIPSKYSRKNSIEKKYRIKIYLNNCDFVLVHIKNEHRIPMPIAIWLMFVSEMTKKKNLVYIYIYKHLYIVYYSSLFLFFIDNVYICITYHDYRCYFIHLYICMYLFCQLNSITMMKKQWKYREYWRRRQIVKQNKLRLKEIQFSNYNENGQFFFSGEGEEFENTEKKENWNMFERRLARMRATTVEFFLFHIARC